MYICRNVGVAQIAALDQQVRERARKDVDLPNARLHIKGVMTVLINLDQEGNVGAFAQLASAHCSLLHLPIAVADGAGHMFC
mgnify:CR=1 FL=1